jgi:adenylate cyclase
MSSSLAKTQRLSTLSLDALRREATGELTSDEGSQGTVLFADVASSTTMYEVLGDTIAKGMVDQAVTLLKLCTARYGGQVVKTIGDEILCLFDDADRAMLAAADMQAEIHNLPVENGFKRQLRVGFHSGPLIREAGDVFGDTVNVASRLTQLARGMQVLTSSSTMQQLSPAFARNLRRLANLTVRGKQSGLEVFEAVWLQEDQLTLTQPSPIATGAAHEMLIAFQGRNFSVGGGRRELEVGRDPACHIVLSHVKASRRHARIEQRGEKFFLVDASSNGTFVTFDNQPEIALWHEELVLRGVGCIRFGIDSQTPDDAPEPVLFRVRP